MPVIDSLNQFRASIADVNAFIGLAYKQDAGGQYLLPTNQREFITDSAFLKAFIAWEAFLEGLFVRYLNGEVSISGNAILKYASPRDDAHARGLLIGTQKYVDWSNPEIVRRLSNLFFDPGNPLDSTLSSIQSDLFDLKTIRNAAAHLTSTTSASLDALATRKLRQPCVNISVSNFIFSIDPASPTSDTILTTYLALLDLAAETISNG